MSEIGCCGSMENLAHAPQHLIGTFAMQENLMHAQTSKITRTILRNVLPITSCFFFTGLGTREAMLNYFM